MAAPQSTTIDDNKAIVRRVVEGFINQPDIAQAHRVADELWHDDYKWIPVSDDQPMDKETHKRDFPDLRTIFGDLHCTVEHQIAEGDLVASHVTMRGTHIGEMKTPFGTFAATHKPVSWQTMSIHRIRDGKVIEGWIVYNPLDALQQLGFVNQWPEGYGSAKPRRQ